MKVPMKSDMENHAYAWAPVFDVACSPIMVRMMRPAPENNPEECHLRDVPRKAEQGRPKGYAGDAVDERWLAPNAIS